MIIVIVYFLFTGKFYDYSSDLFSTCNWKSP